MKIDDDFNLDDDSEIPNTNLDTDIIKNNIQNYSSEKLCDMIVCERYLGFQKEIAIICMEELSRRRIYGDQFEFENYIDNSLNSLPKIEFNMPDLRSVLNNVIGNKK